MSDLLNGVPCQYCSKYYGHSKDCFSNTQTGIAEKMMFLEIERRHSMICHNLEAKNAELEKKLVDAEKAFQDKNRALNAAITMWDIETKKLEIVRDCAVRYLDAEDMAAKRTCDKELLRALAAIKDA